jgi:hypothetical protein
MTLGNYFATKVTTKEKAKKKNDDKIFFDIAIDL